MQQYVVEYTVNPPFVPCVTTRTVGPYTIAEAIMHRDDIKGYEGITDCQIVVQKAT